MINAVPPADLRSGMGPGLGMKAGGHQGGAVSRHVDARGAPRQLADVTGYPLCPLVLRQADPRLHPSLQQRPRTAGNVLGPGSEDEVTSRTTVDSREASPITTEQKVFVTVPPARASRHVRESRVHRGLIVGLIHLRSCAFIGILINTPMQAANVSAIQRTIIPTPENRKVGGSPCRSGPTSS